jgi:hypothetical protein
VLHCHDRGGPATGQGIFIIHKRANKNLDREKQFHYIHSMFTLTMVLLKAGHKEAWQRIAMAEGGFY